VKGSQSCETIWKRRRPWGISYECSVPK
jgi:hypothetical protein